MSSAATGVSRRLPAALIERIRRIECGGARAGPARSLSTGWPAVDAALPHGGLLAGAIHEWLGLADEDRSAIPLAPSQARASIAMGERSPRIGDRGSIQLSSGPWRPCLRLLIHLAHRACGTAAVAWIGQTVWPHGRALVQGDDRRLLHAALLVAARNVSDRVFATELALRCPAIALVIVDASSFDTVAGRRLQLAAEAGSSLGLLARPATEEGLFSAAVTRWRVSRMASSGFRQRWMVRLLRCKGMQPTAEAARRFVVQHDHVSGALGASAVVADRSGDAACEARSTG